MQKFSHPLARWSLLMTAVAAVPTTAAAAGVQPVGVPAAARAVDTSNPTRFVGNGTAKSCTSRAVVAAVKAGGVIRFRCGSAPVTIVMQATAKVLNTRRRVVLDGGGKVTLSGGGVRRILYMNTCDPAQVWTTSHCQNQATPQLVVQNLRFVAGNSTGQRMDGGGGGAIFVRGGRVKIVGSTFVGNRCERTGPDIGGGAVRVLSQYRNLPVYVTRSTFTGGRCSNGSALSSIGVSWVVLNSTFRGNRAIGIGANPARSGTPGGGSGGALYADGNRFTVTVAGTLMENNHAREGGGAIFFVSNNRTGRLIIDRSTLRSNVSARFQTHPGIFYLGSGPITRRSSVIR